MTDAAQPVICMEGVHFSYGTQAVLEDADFDIFAGESICVVGPNGGGKSTLLKLILGLLKPDAGRVQLFGEQPARVRNRVGYVPQQISFDSLFPISALEVCLMGSLNRRSFGSTSRAERAAAVALFESMELSHLLEAPFPSLSGGQRQRVAIARALVTTPSILLADEPTGNLDPDTAKDVFGHLAAITRATRTAALVVTHNQQLALNMDSILTIENGHVVELA